MRRAALTAMVGAVAILAAVLFAFEGGQDVVESAAPTTTSTSTTTTTTEAPQSVPASPPSTIEATIADEGELAAPDLTMDVEVAQLGDTFIRFRFRSSEPTAYTTTVTDQEGNVVGQTDGLLTAGQVKTERVEGLEAGTLYSARATLIGPPAVESSAVLFRTTGAEPSPADDAATAPVEIRSLRISELEPFHFQFDYLSNVCANGSFVVIKQETGEEVGHNNGHPNGCVGKHLGVPGRWTPPLEPSTTYVVVLTLEANGEFRGRQYGNAVTESFEVTTPPRDIPADPAERSAAPVSFASMEQMETDAESVRIDFTTNVCTNASFVVREVGGGEVGRHDGFPRGCTNEHSAIPGLWTSPLEPDTSYTVIITAEADGSGAGDGNIATESITVRTAPAIAPNPSPPEQVAIESIQQSINGDTADVTVTTNICATVSVLSYAQPGPVLGTTAATDVCSLTSTITDVPLAPDNKTILLVSVEAEEFGPGTPNRASDNVIVGQ